MTDKSAKNTEITINQTEINYLENEKSKSQILIFGEKNDLNNIYIQFFRDKNTVKTILDCTMIDFSIDKLCNIYSKINLTIPNSIFLLLPDYSNKGWQNDVSNYFVEDGGDYDLSKIPENIKFLDTIPFELDFLF